MGRILFDGMTFTLFLKIYLEIVFHVSRVDSEVYIVRLEILVFGYFIMNICIDKKDV